MEVYMFSSKTVKTRSVEHCNRWAISPTVAEVFASARMLRRCRSGDTFPQEGQRHSVMSA